MKLRYLFSKKNDCRNECESDAKVFLKNESNKKIIRKYKCIFEIKWSETKQPIHFRFYSNNFKKY